MHLGDGVHHVNRNPDGPTLVGDRPGDRLTDPPGGVGGEFETLAILEFLDGSDQTEIAFLNQVEERKFGVSVAFCDGDDKTKIGADERLTGILAEPNHLTKLSTLGRFLLGFEGYLRLASSFDRFGKSDFVLRCEQVI